MKYLNALAASQRVLLGILIVWGALLIIGFSDSMNNPVTGYMIIVASEIVDLFLIGARDESPRTFMFLLGFLPLILIGVPVIVYSLIVHLRGAKNANA